MHIIIKLKRIPDINGLVHESTSWSIATDIGFTNIVESLNTSTIYKDIYYSTITVPISTTYYVRATRHFNDSNNDYTTDIIPVTNDTDDISNMLLQEDIVIQQPTISLDVNTLRNEDPTFIVTASDFKSNYDTHAYTHWIVEDSLGNIVYTSLYDNSNLTSITIDKTYDFLTKNELMFKVIYCNSTGIQSEVGTYRYSLGDVNFEIVSDIVNIQPYTNYTLLFNKKDNNLPIRINTIKILNYNTNEVLYTFINTSDLTEYTIPYYILQENITLKIQINCYDTKSKVIVLNKFISTRKNKFIDILEPSYVYNKSLSNVIEDTNIILSESITSIQNLNNEVLVTQKNSQYVFKYTYDETNNTLNSTLFALNGINLPNNTYSFLHSVTRSDETIPNGKTNSIFQKSLTEFIYIPYGTNKLKSYNFITNTITNINTVPISNNLNCTIVKLNTNRILIIGGDTSETYIYDLNSDEFIESFNITPSSYVNVDLKSVKLINGDTILYKINKDPLDTDNSILYFTYNTGELTELNLTFTQDTYPTSSISLLNGDVLLTSYIPENIPLTITEKTLIQRFY
jgi:hypothetical protein